MRLPKRKRKCVNSATSAAHATPKAKKKIREQYDECRVYVIRREKRKYLNSTTSATHATPEAKTEMKLECDTTDDACHLCWHAPKAKRK